MKSIFVAISIIIGISVGAFAQTAKHTENSADQTLRGSGRVNGSTLGMEVNIPLGNYPGRGINVPISLSYSSKVWRTDYITSQPAVNNPDNCISQNVPKFAEDTASGWTTSMAVPFVEYTGSDGIFNNGGFPAGSDDPGCSPNTPPTYTENAYVKRIVIHLPSGETHELRADDIITIYPASQNPAPLDFNQTFYAVDGSNIRYVENSLTGMYRLLMPDGSYYDFAGTRSAQGSKSVRKATKFSDRNGNFTTYDAVSNTLTDTLGRTLTSPLGLAAPASANIQTYAMPGMTGTYKLHWKQLKGSYQGDSAITDFNTPLKYIADRSSPNPNTNPRAAGTYLFVSDFSAWVHDAGAGLFNPILLAKIELPTGQIYEFKYDIYGRIERVIYPTGGEERFEFGVVAPLAHTDTTDINAQTNFGVAKRQVYTTANTGTPLEWLYTAAPVVPNGYKVTTTAPDATRTERYLHRNLDTSGTGTFGYDTAIAGMPYDERSYSSINQLVSQKLTTWAATTIGTTSSGGYAPPQPAKWHPRVTQEESRVYDSTGNGVSATTKYEYEGNLDLRDTPLLQKKTSQYAFVTVGSAVPANPMRSTETIFLINDPAYSATKSLYTDQNMMGLVTASVVKDSAGTVVSRGETVYDESGRSPNAGRGNPTTAKAWDSTKGAYTNSSAYISTSARFNSYGNQYESSDAKGNTTTTTFDSTYQAFPVQVTSPVPSDGTYGSNSSFITSATFNYTTGLPLTTTDANGLETRIEYDTTTLRPLNTKTFYQNNQVGATAETIYNDVSGSQWVKNRTQIDTNKWAESITTSTAWVVRGNLKRSIRTETSLSRKNSTPKGESAASQIRSVRARRNSGQRTSTMRSAASKR